MMITSLHPTLNWERDPIMHKKAVPALADSPLDQSTADVADAPTAE